MPSSSSPSKKEPELSIESMIAYNGLTPAQLERLYLLAEELAEGIHIIGKILRHGYASYHPRDPVGVSNRDLLIKELGDINYASILLEQSGDIPELTDDIQARTDEKAVEVREYLHHQPSKLLNSLLPVFHPEYENWHPEDEHEEIMPPPENPPYHPV